MNKASKPACDFRCNSTPELELECETCLGRNELKPMPGMEPLPRFRLCIKPAGTVGYVYRGEWHASDGVCWMLDAKNGSWRDFPGNSWIQFERNEDAK